MPLIFHSMNFMHMLLGNTEQYGNHGEKRINIPKSAESCLNYKKDFRRAEIEIIMKKNPSSIAIGLLTTLF